MRLFPHEEYVYTNQLHHGLWMMVIVRVVEYSWFGKVRTEHIESFYSENPQPSLRGPKYGVRFNWVNENGCSISSRKLSRFLNTVHVEYELDKRAKLLAAKISRVKNEMPNL